VAIDSINDQDQDGQDWIRIVRIIGIVRMIIRNI
jgi:hypothetical protein